MLVTALEANADVPKMNVVTERLLHEERKQKDREDDKNHEEAIMTRLRGPVKCYYCGKPGHIKQNCPHLDSDEKSDERKSKLSSRKKKGKHKANKVSEKARHGGSSDSDADAFVDSHALQASSSVGNWIIDSGTTCHMCGSEKFFEKIQQPNEVTLGDGHPLKVAGQEVVSLKTKLSDGSTRRCKLLDVSYVPALEYNLLSVSKAAENGKIIKFDEDGCQILTSDKVIAKGIRCGSLYYLDYKADPRANVARQESKESVWHRRYGHLGVQNMQKLVRDNMVKGLDYDHSRKAGDVCEACKSEKPSV